MQFKKTRRDWQVDCGALECRTKLTGTKGEIPALSALEHGWAVMSNGGVSLSYFCPVHCNIGQLAIHKAARCQFGVAMERWRARV